MKKFSLFLLIALVIGSIFISCSSDLETADSSTAKVALNLSTAKALTVSVETEDLPSADQLRWYYTAVKHDNGFTTGETHGEVTIIGGDIVGIPVRGDNELGIPVRIGYSNADPDHSGTWFSTGEWLFSFYGVKEVGETKTIIYSAESSDIVTVSAATEGNNIGGEANITLGLHDGDPRSACSVFIGGNGITVDLGRSFESGADYTMEVYLNDTPIKTISDDIENTQVVKEGSEVTFKANGNIIGSVTNINAGFNILTFKVFKDEDIVYAQGAVNITVSQGVTWTISGSLDNLDAVAQVAIIQEGGVPNLTYDDFVNQQVILINSAEELVDFANYVNDGHNCSGKTIYLTEDIDISSIANWIPIGNSARKSEGAYFAGTFDGGGHTITGLRLTSVTDKLMVDEEEEDTSAPDILFDEYIFGLFGKVKNATIKNLTLSGVNIANLNSNINNDENHKLTGENIGALIGYSEGSLTVDKITVASGSVAGGSNVAGIIGRAYGKSTDAKISITNCVNHANITSTNGSGNKAKAAGIVGYLSGLGAEVVVENCTNDGALSSSANNHAIAAGIVNYGFNNSYTTEKYTVKGNTNSGNITVTSTNGGCLYAAISAECNDGKQSTDTITAKGNTNSGTITVNNAPQDEVVLVRSSQNGAEANTNNT